MMIEDPTAEQLEQLLASGQPVAGLVLSHPLHSCWTDRCHPDFHVQVVGYAQQGAQPLLLTIHGVDSSMPGVGLSYASARDDLEPCNCGAWEPAPSEEAELNARLVYAHSLSGEDVPTDAP